MARTHSHSGAFVTLLSVAIFATSCSSGKVNPLSGGSEKIAGQIKAERIRLPNGLKIIIAEDKSSPTFAFQTWYRVGSKNEEAGKTGLAHLFEHMMFKGTGAFPEGEFDRILESVGAEGENAFTNHDHTVYVQELPSSQIETIIRLEADRMQNLIVNEKSFSTEVEVVQNERRFRNENNPDGLIGQSLYELVYEKHPYRWPVIGYAEDLSRMKAEDALAFYRKFYQPERATVVIVGDVDRKKTIEWINRYYAPLKNAHSVPATAKIEETQPSRPRRKTLKLNIQLQRLTMGYLTTPAMHADTPALMVLEDLLASGKSSRLSKALVDTGIATYVGAYHQQGEDPSIFTIDAGLQKGHAASQAEQVVLAEIRKLQSQGITETELVRAKNRILFALYSGLESNSERAEFIGRFESLAGDYREGFKKLKDIDAVTAKDIQRVAKQYLVARARSVVIGVPK